MNTHRKKAFKKGTYVYIEDDEDAEEIFIVRSGEIALETINKNVIRFRQTAGPGEVFGFISSLCGRPRMESAFARTDCEIHIFKKENFLALLSKNSDIAMKVINNFADELRAYDEMIFSMKARRESVPDDIRLFRLGIFFLRQGERDYAYYVLSRFVNLYPASTSAAEARDELLTIETSGIRKVLEPVIQGVHLVYTDRQIVFAENEPGNSLYLIREGKVKIFKNIGDSQIMLSILSKGDIFGELSIVSNKTRNATAVCDGQTVLIGITRDNLSTMLQKSPTLLNKIYASISERLWFTYIRIESRLYEKPITRIYAFLENKLMEEKIALKSPTSYTFNFGIDELLKMTDITQENLGESINDLLDDQNLGFNFGEIRILRASDVAAKAKYYKSRDRFVAGPGEPGTADSPRAAQRKKPAENSPAAHESTGNEFDREQNRLFSELSDEIDPK